MKTVSIVIPVYNEEKNVDRAYRELSRVMGALSREYRYELVFTDNHSSDRTFELLAAIAAKDKRVRVLSFSRNFGYQRSILTGYLHARGDAAIQIDCDLQDPPDMIPAMLKKWREGYKVVYGVREHRKESFIMRSVRSLFYRILHYLSEEKIPVDAGDFRLIDRAVLNELKNLRDAKPYIRGSIAAMGFAQTGIPYKRDERKYGVSKFKLSSLMDLALDGILNHSVVPLRIATFIGLMTSVVTFLMLCIYVVGKIIFDQAWPAGFATTTVLLLLSISLNAIFLGIIGEYLGRIYLQTKQGPVTIVEKKVNIR